MTPSLAATTRMTMSVTEAPRARMAVKAACPGVSRKVAVTCRCEELPVSHHFSHRYTAHQQACSARLRAGQGDLKGADVLRDATRLTSCHCRVPQRIQQGSLQGTAASIKT